MPLVLLPLLPNVPVVLASGEAMAEVSRLLRLLFNYRNGMKMESLSAYTMLGHCLSVGHTYASRMRVVKCRAGCLTMTSPSSGRVGCCAFPRNTFTLYRRFQNGCDQGSSCFTQSHQAACTVFQAQTKQPRRRSAHAVVSHAGLHKDISTFYFRHHHIQLHSTLISHMCCSGPS